MNKNINQHIENYLDYYTGLKIAPEFAVLLRGDWGSGKTWFIEYYLKRKPDLKHLYVSLNGISSFQEIEDSFFQQLHPVLASKGMKLAGKILKGIVKASIKVDLDNDDKSDGNLLVQAPDINLPEYLKNLDDKTLIFDDLERCAISIPVILGYINQFVEINGLKVIILGNENEIIRREEEDEDEESQKYRLIKEKIIGKSFNINSVLNQALHSFVEQLTSQNTKKLLKDKLYIITDIFHTAGYNNLRHLRQSILDFERFLGFLPNDIYSKKGLIDHIMELYFTLSIELKKGKIRDEDITRLFSSAPSSNVKEENKTPVDQVWFKYYDIFNKSIYPFESHFFEQFFKYGYMDEEGVKKSVLNSYYFMDENTPSWIKLWHFWELEDNEFKKVLSIVFDRFNNAKIEDKYELLQTSGILLELSKIGLLQANDSQIVEQAKNNLSLLRDKGMLILYKDEDFPLEHSHGLGIRGKKSDNYKEIAYYAKQERLRTTEKNHEQEAKKLLALLAESPEEFEKRVTYSSYPESTFYDIPILKFIPVNEFATKVIQLSNKNIYLLNNILRKRYDFIDSFPNLKEEVDWLHELYKEIDKVKDNHKGEVSGLLLKGGTLKVLKEIIGKIEAIENNDVIQNMEKNKN